MTREEFEVKYAMKYWPLDMTHNSTESLESMKSNRNGEGYTDHHIDLSWIVQKAKDKENTLLRGLAVQEIDW